MVVAGADTQAGQPVAALYPSLAAAYPALEFSKVGADDLAGLDVVFLALPHGESQELAPDLVGRVGLLVDLSADFRLRDAGGLPAVVRARPRRARSCSGEFVYGLPELFRAELAGARLVAAPGCYPDGGGAGAGAAGPGRRDRDDRRHRRRRQRRVGGGAQVVAHHALQHRRRGLHRLRAAAPPPHARDRAGIGAQVLFTPHLAPMNRGHPGHLLRAPGRSSSPPTTCSASCATRTPASPSWW